MSETLFYNPNTTIATDTIATGNISVNLDLLDQWLYLRPSVSNAATIVAGMMRFGNTYGQSSFGTNVFSTQGISNASLFGTTTTVNMYGGVYMPGGYVFLVDGNGGGTCAVVSSKENTVTNYSVAGTGGNGMNAGCLLPDGRAITVPGTGRNFVIWNNITRTSTTLARPAGYTKFQTATQTADGNIAFSSDAASNVCILNTSTFTFSNAGSLGTRVFSVASQLDVTGNVILSPLSAAAGVGVWNPAAGTVFSVTATGVNDYLRASAIAGDGRVIWEPGTAAFIPTYNPFTLTYTSYAAPWAGGSLKFGSARTLPDGRVMLCPSFGGTYFAIFNHITNAITTWSPVYAHLSFSNNGKFVPDGRLILPNGGGSNVPVMTNLSRGVPEAWCMHPFFNKSQ
jgi:hypothetical protein